MKYNMIEFARISSYLKQWGEELKSRSKEWQGRLRLYPNLNLQRKITTNLGKLKLKNQGDW